MGRTRTHCPQKGVTGEFLLRSEASSLDSSMLVLEKHTLGYHVISYRRACRQSLHGCERQTQQLPRQTGGSFLSGSSSVWR